MCLLALYVFSLEKCLVYLDSLPLFNWVFFLYINLHERKKDSAKSCLTLAIPWTVAWQAPLSMGFSRQEYWSRLPFTSAGELPKSGIEPRSPALEAGALLTELCRKPNLKTRMSCLYTLEINPLWVPLFANIFSHSMGYIFILFRLSLDVSELYFNILLLFAGKRPSCFRWI